MKHERLLKLAGIQQLNEDVTNLKNETKGIAEFLLDALGVMGIRDDWDEVLADQLQHGGKEAARQKFEQFNMVTTFVNKTLGKNLPLISEEDWNEFISHE